MRIGDLINVMSHDPYPGVRRIAARSLEMLLPQRPLPCSKLFGTTTRRKHALAHDYHRGPQDMLPRDSWIAPDAAWAEDQRSRAATVNIEIGVSDAETKMCTMGME